MKLQSKIIITVIPFVLAPVLIIALLVVDNYIRQIEQNIEQRVEQILTQVSQDVQQYLRTNTASLDLLAKNEVLQRYLLIDDEFVRFGIYQKNILKIFSGFNEVFPNYYEIKILQADGYEDTWYSNTNADNLSVQEADSELFQKMHKSKADLNTYFLENPDNLEQSLYISKRMVLANRHKLGDSAEAQLRGYLIATTDLSFFSNLLDKSIFGEQGHLLLLNQNGKIIASSYNSRPDQHQIDIDFDKASAQSDHENFSVMEIGHQKHLFRSLRINEQLLLVVMIPELEYQAKMSDFLTTTVTIRLCCT